MNFSHILIVVCVCLSSMKAANLEAPGQPATTMRREKSRPPKLNFPPDFGCKTEGLSTVKPAMIPSGAAGRENAATQKTTEVVNPKQSTDIGDTPIQLSAKEQQQWIQTELTRLIEEGALYDDLDSFRLSCWSNADPTSKFLITVQMFEAWKRHIGNRVTLAPKWMAEFLAPFADDCTHPKERRMQANETLGEITKIAKRISMQEEQKASSEDSAPTNIVPKPKVISTPPLATAGIYSYTADRAFEVVCAMKKKLSKKTNPCDKRVTETLEHIAGNQEVTPNSRAFAYIVLGNARFDPDCEISCYELALTLNPDNQMKAHAHLGLARAHKDAPTNCQTAIALAPQDPYIIKNAPIVWGNALASRDYGNNNLGSLLVYFMSKNDTGISVKKHSTFIRRDLKLYDAYHKIGDAAFRNQYPEISDGKIKQFQLTDEDKKRLEEARTCFKFQ